MSTTTTQARINPDLFNQICQLALSGQSLLEICEKVGQPIHLVHSALLASGVSASKVRQQQKQRRLVDEGVRQKVCQMALNGDTVREISTSVLQPTHVVTKILGQANISPMNIRRAQRERAQQEQEIAFRAAKLRLQEAFVERYASGETLQEIAATMGVTAEAVRRRMVRAGISPRETRRQVGHTRATELAALSATANQWVQQHIGCTVTELASELGLAEHESMALLSRRSVRLVLHRDEIGDASPHKNTKWSRSAILAALQSAAEIYSPLSKNEYQNLVHQQVVNGPSASRLIHIYGTWATACDSAGVLPHETPAINYTRQWTREDMVQGIFDFLKESENLSKDSYETWQKCGHNLPGYLTVSNEFGGWQNAIVAGLRKHRRKWASSGNSAATIAPGEN